MTAPLIKGASGIEGDKITYASINENNQENIINDDNQENIINQENNINIINQENYNNNNIDYPFAPIQ